MEAMQDRITLMTAGNTSGSSNTGSGSGNSARASNSGSGSLAGLSSISPSVPPVMAALAKALHSELDGHRRSVEAMVGDLAQQFHAIRGGEMEALATGLATLQRTAVTNKAHLLLVERVMSLESQLRSLTNLHGFSSQKLANHLETWGDWVARSTCGHCQSGVLAAANCREKKCGKKICNECSMMGHNGHTAAVPVGSGHGGSGFDMASGSPFGSDGSANGSYGYASSPPGSSGGLGFGSLLGSNGTAPSSGNAMLLPNAAAILTVVESSPHMRELVSRVLGLHDAQQTTRRVVDGLANQLGALLTMLGKCNLVIPNIDATGPKGDSSAQPDPTQPFKLGPSSSLLLDVRSVSYFSALADFLQSGLPEVLTRLLASEERGVAQGEALARWERRSREVESASRPFVEERVAMLSGKINLLEKSTLKKLRAEVRRVEEEMRERNRKEKEAAAAAAGGSGAMGAETSLARVHYRCVACDQVVAGQPGPLSKEYAAQIAHTHHGHTHSQLTNMPQSHHVHHTSVGGFASALPSQNPSALPPSHSPHPSSSLSDSSSLFVSSDRAHLFIDPGQRITLHAHSGSEVYRGREDTRVSFTSTAAAAAAGRSHSKSPDRGDRDRAASATAAQQQVDGKPASFHTTYAERSVVVPLAGSSMPRSAGGRTARQMHQPSSSDGGVNLPRINLSSTQPISSSSGAASARAASSAKAAPPQQQPPSGSQSTRAAGGRGAARERASMSSSAEYNAEGERKEE